MLEICDLLSQGFHQHPRAATVHKGRVPELPNNVRRRQWGTVLDCARRHAIQFVLIVANFLLRGLQLIKARFEQIQRTVTLSGRCLQTAILLWPDDNRLRSYDLETWRLPVRVDRLSSRLLQMNIVEKCVNIVCEVAFVHREELSVRRSHKNVHRRRARHHEVIRLYWRALPELYHLIRLPKWLRLIYILNLNVDSQRPTEICVCLGQLLISTLRICFQLLRNFRLFSLRFAEVSE